MMIEVMLSNAKGRGDYAPLGNCGCCGEEEFMYWVDNDFAPQSYRTEGEHTTLDRKRLKAAIDKAQAAGYDVKVGCGCGEGWCDQRCDGDDGCVVNQVVALAGIKRFQ